MKLTVLRKKRGDEAAKSSGKGNELDTIMLAAGYTQGRRLNTMKLTSFSQENRNLWKKEREHSTGQAVI